MISHFQRGILSLIAIALIVAFIWRLEVDRHGWDGLVWTSYFHWSIPIGILLFTAWLAVFCSVQPIGHRIAFLFSFLIFSAAAYLLFSNSIIEFYSLVLFPFRWDWFWLWHFSIFIIFPLLPWLSFALARLFRAPLTLKGMGLSFLLYLLAFPLAIMLLKLLYQERNADELQAIKSGFVIPFLVVSYGLPFILGKPTTDLRPIKS